MGVVRTKIVFDGRAPALHSICEKITDLTGLPLLVEESGADIKADLYDTHAYIAFACVPANMLEVRAYAPGQTWSFPPPPAADGTDTRPRLLDPSGTQAVHLGTYMFVDLTLMYSAIRAMESLGGRPDPPLEPNELRACDGPVTPEQLEVNQRKLNRQARLSCALGVLLFPVWLTFFVLMIPWKIYRIYSIYRRIKAAYPQK